MVDPGTYSIPFLESNLCGAGLHLIVGTVNLIVTDVVFVQGLNAIYISLTI